MATTNTVSVRDVQAQLLSAIRANAARSEALARDKEAEAAKLYAEAARELAAAWQALHGS